MSCRALRSSLLAACICVVTQGCQAAPTQEGTLLIRSATLIDGTGGPPRASTSILIRGDRIIAVTPDSLAGDFVAAQVIDASGKWAIPGLADTHFHFGLGAPIRPRSNEREESLARELYYGVTTILQIGATSGSSDSINSLRGRVAGGVLSAPYIYGTGGHLTLQGTHPIYTIFPPDIREAADRLAADTPLQEPVDLFSLGIGMSFVRTEEAARTAVRERAAGGMHAIKITVESGPTPFGDDHPLMPVSMITAIVDEAAQHGLRVLAHVTSTNELEAALRGGADAAVHATQGLPLPDSVLADAMVASGFGMIPTLTLFAGPGDFADPFLLESVSAEEISALQEAPFMAQVGRRWTCCASFDQVLETVGMLHERGVAFAVGTDTGNPYVYPGYSVHREMSLLVRAGLTPMEAIVAATRGAAEMIGVDDEFGTVTPGKRADLVILSADPLATIDNTRFLDAVIAQGRVVDRNALRRGFR